MLTPKFRVSFPTVFKPRLNKLNNQEEYGLVALFEKGEDLSGLKAAVIEACEKKWGPDKKKWPKNLRNPLRDQADKAKDIDGKQVLPPGHEEGAFFLNLKSKQRPQVVDQNVQDIIDQSDFYPGCYARASVQAYAYDHAGNRGVAFGLNNIQKVADGEPFGGKTNATDDFSAIAGAKGAETAADIFD